MNLLSLSLDAFGDAVIAAIRRSTENNVTSIVPQEVEQVRSADALVVVGAHPNSSAIGKVDRLARHRNLLMMPVIYEHPDVIFGPSVWKGTGSCFACFRKRQAQHSAHPEVLAARDAHYARFPNDVPSGALPAIVAFVAGATIELLRENLPAGSVRTLNVLTLEMKAGSAVGINGCDGCGEPTRWLDRSVLGLDAVVMYTRVDREVH